MGGIVFGPSLLGHESIIGRVLFPVPSTLVIETIATFGLMFFLFAIGVKMDHTIMLRPGRKAMIIGVSVFFFTLVLPSLLVVILNKTISMDPSLVKSLPFIAASQSLTGFPVIACLLTELKILNTDIGRLALSTSMFCDVIGISLTAVALTVTQNKGGNITTAILAVLSSVALLIGIVYVLRPAVMWMRNRTHNGKPVNEIYVFAIFVFVLLAGFFSEVVGQHYVLGPLIMGLVVPDGPPLGVALVSKVETLASGLFYPTYLAVSGLQTNIFEIQFQATWVIGLIVLFSCIVKIGAVFLPARYTDLPPRDALVLGLILNAKGIVELMVFNFWKGSKLLTDEEFALLVISVLIVTAIITPLVKVLYDPSKQYYSVMRSTIQHSKRESEFRILVGIHHRDSIPTLINLLEVSNASEESTIEVIALILMELIGRTTPVLIAHQPHQSLQRSTSSSTQILNALRQYEEHNEGYATVQSFTSVSYYDTMHEDVFRVALDKRAAIIILPFHKQWAIDGSIGSVNRAIQSLNINVLEFAPCSVGILIDRGILSRPGLIMNTGTPYHVAVLFIGGPDDAESLAYGFRMAKHHCVDLTVVWFLLFGAENTKDRKHDSELINEYREANMGNEHFVVVEEVVKDGVGLAATIKRMADCFDLMIVGRHHQQTQLLTALGEWSECPELGVVGDMLASPDFKSSASVLVVQQQRLGAGRLAGCNMKRVVNDKQPLIHDVPHGRPTRGTWSITMER